MVKWDYLNRAEVRRLIINNILDNCISFILPMYVHYIALYNCINRSIIHLLNYSLFNYITDEKRQMYCEIDLKWIEMNWNRKKTRASKRF